MGEILVLGDIKTLWAKVGGLTEMEATLRMSGDAWMMNPQADRTEFNRYRPSLWASLRREYRLWLTLKLWRVRIQQHISVVSLKGESKRQKKMQKAVLCWLCSSERMPVPVKNRLEDGVGLTLKTHREFCDHVVHVVKNIEEMNWDWESRIET